MKHITSIFLFISIYFQVQAQSNVPLDKDEVIFTTVGTPPSFPGGQDSLNAYLKKNVVYPIALAESGIEGIAAIQVIVEKDGRISGISSTTRCLEYSSGETKCRKEFLEEAERVALTMPRWTPAKHAGKTVRCYYVVPIKFCPAGCAGK